LRKQITFQFDASYELFFLKQFEGQIQIKKQLETKKAWNNESNAHIDSRDLFLTDSRPLISKLLKIAHLNCQHSFLSFCSFIKKKYSLQIDASIQLCFLNKKLQG